MKAKTLARSGAGLDEPRAVPGPAPPDAVELLVTQLIGRVADKWTMVALEELGEAGELRFSRLADRIPGISSKMLTQTLRHMERDGLVVRTVFAEVPPRVHYRLSNLGISLGAAFCDVWIWAEQHLAQIEAARHIFDNRHRP